MVLDFVFIVGMLSIAVGAYFFMYVARQGTGTKEMRAISDSIKEGAIAFIKRQYGTIALFSVIMALLIGGLYFYKGDPGLALRTSIAIILGAASSAIAGIIGMYVAVITNIRTAAAVKKSLPFGLKVALRGGAVSGILVISLSLMGVAGLYWLFGADPLKTPFLIVGYGFGASFVALFAQLGGGIYTKAADVGADLVGKVEAGMIASIIGIFSVKAREGEDPMRALNRGFYVSAFLALIGIAISVNWLLNANVWFFYAGMVGIVMSVLFLLITEYYTSHGFRPVKEIAKASQTGPATNIISGIAVGLENVFAPVIVISFALYLSYQFGVWSGVPHGGLFGIAVATVGMQI